MHAIAKPTSALASPDAHAFAVWQRKIMHCPRLFHHALVPPSRKNIAQLFISSSMRHSWLTSQPNTRRQAALLSMSACSAGDRIEQSAPLDWGVHGITYFGVLLRLA
jgi:hypothetical protein